MGVNKEKIFLTVTKNVKPKFFIDSQLFWGHKKSSFNPKLSVYILGFSNSFSVINFERSIEFFKKCILLCFEFISNNKRLLFLSTKLNYRKLIVFFGIRCFQMVFSQKWIHGILTRNLIKSDSVMISPKLDRNLIAETFKLLYPMICIEDTNYRVNRTFYSVIGNDDSKKKHIFFFEIVY